eukprot:c23891_g1_i3 orf=566-1633(+)
MQFRAHIQQSDSPRSPSVPMVSKKHYGSEAGWRPCLILSAITIATCVTVYFVLSPLFSASEYLQEFDARTVETEAQSAACCRGIDHLELWGKAVKWGTHHIVNTSQECCQACKDMCSDSGPCLCDSWVFCADRNRCGDKFGQCWLKKQEDPLTPDVQESSDKVIWTSGLVYGKGMGILSLDMEHGAIHIKLLPECAPASVLYLLELLKVRHCAGCQFYRAEGRGTTWDIEGNPKYKNQAGPPYALIQGTLEVYGTSFKDISSEATPLIKRGMVGWIGGGPEFFISLANHNEWYPKYTVFASVLPESMPLVEKLASLPTSSVVWDGVKVSLLQKYVRFKLSRSVRIYQNLSTWRKT